MSAVSERGGMQECKLIEDIERYMMVNGEPKPKMAMQRIKSSISQYKEIEEKLRNARAAHLLRKEEVASCRKLVDLLQRNHEEGTEMTMKFMICESAYATATIPPTDTVVLSLGANTLAEFRLDEARVELDKIEQRINERLSDVESRIDFVHEQITTLEVNLTRISSYMVIHAQKQESATA